MTDELSFGRWLKGRRKDLELTQEALAEQAGCSVETIRKIEAGNLRPSRQLAELLAAGLGIPQDEQPAFVQWARAALRPDTAARPARATVAAVGAPRATAGPATVARPPTNLPIPPTPLVGREQELAAALARLRHPDVRLVTFTGPGGTGKTRLAMQVCEQLLDTFPDGVFFVPLSPLNDPTLVAPTIARILGVHEAEGRPVLDNLQDFLRDKRILVLLDNFEQVTPAAPLVTRLLEAASRLKVLVTSRALLHLRGEYDFPVPPLGLPDPRQLPPLDQMLAFDAVRLFVDRAQDVRPDFELTDENAAAVAAICVRLDGLPLAIELAAAWVRLLRPQAVLARLDQRLLLLTGGARDLPERQQTLRNTMAWSYELLDPGEQMLFRRLAVFVRGCTLESVEAVIAGWGLNEATPPFPGPPPPPLETDVLDGIAGLMDKSLLRQEVIAGDTRFWMLATIREYALERLGESGEAEALRAAHRAWFLQWAETADTQFRRSDQAQWLDRIEAEHNNLRIALAAWMADPDGVQATLRLAGALGVFWDVRGYWAEGRRIIEAALARPGAEAPTRARAYALMRLAALIQDPVLARARLDESVTIWRTLGDRHGLVYALVNLAEKLRQQGDLAGARALAEEGLALGEALGDQRTRAGSLYLLGRIAVEQDDLTAAQSYFMQSLALYGHGDQRGRANCLYQQARVALAEGDYAEARRVLEEMLAIHRGLGDTNGMAWALNGLGEVARHQEDYAEASARYDEAMRLFWEQGFKGGIAVLLHNRAWVAQAQGDLEQAAALFGVSLVLGRELGSKRIIAETLSGLAGVACGAGQMERAARLFGAADALLTVMGGALSPTDRQARDHELAAVRTALAPATFAAAWSAGGALPLEEAVAYAVEEPNTM